MKDKLFRIALLGTIGMFSVLAIEGIYSAVQNKTHAATPQENCEQYYENAKKYLERAEKRNEWRDANVSAAYSLLYQNCLARQKNR